MMAVTEVNDCRYCGRFHVHKAFQAGISEEELRTYLSGIIPGDIPAEQKLAVAYSKQWAENDAQPDSESQSRIREVYGKEGFEAIEIILRMIRMGNLLGNTGVYIFLSSLIWEMGPVRTLTKEPRQGFQKVKFP